MMSSTASPLKRPSVAIPLSMQKMLAKLQFSKKSRRSMMSNSLCLEYSKKRKRVGFSNIRDATSPHLKKTDDLLIRNEFTNNITTTVTPAQNNNNSSTESVAESHLFKNKKKRIDSPRLVKSDDCTSTKNLNTEQPVTHPKKNDDSNSKNPSCLFGQVDGISSEYLNNELITASHSHMKTTICSQASIPPKSNNETTKQNFNPMDSELSRKLDSFESIEENISPSSVAKQTSNPANDEPLITGHSNANQLTISPQINALDECNSTNTEEKPVIHPNKFLESNLSTQNTKENTTSLSADEPKLDLKNTTPTITAEKKDDDACGFITLNNILQYSSRGSFANELFGDDDEEMNERYTPEFQDKSVPVPRPALKTLSEKNLRLEKNINEKFQAMIQQVREINGMILEANERILNSSKFRRTLGNVDDA